MKKRTKALAGGNAKILAVALVVALFSGTAGAVAFDKIGSKQIRNNSIKSVDLKQKLRKKINTAGGTGRAGTPGEPGEPGTTLVDPRNNSNVLGGVCCLSWARDTDLGDTADEQLTGPSNPIPTAADGRFWREIILDPGTYELEGSWAVDDLGGGDNTTTVVSRLFLGGTPLLDGAGYAFTPASALLETNSASTVITVPSGTPAQRTLVQKVGRLGAGVPHYGDNFMIKRVNITP